MLLGSWEDGSKKRGELCKGPKAGATLGCSQNREKRRCIVLSEQEEKRMDTGASRSPGP